MAGGESVISAELADDIDVLPEERPVRGVRNVKLESRIKLSIETILLSVAIFLIFLVWFEFLRNLYYAAVSDQNYTLTLRSLGFAGGMTLLLAIIITIIFLIF